MMRFRFKEKYPRGRRGSPAKGVVREKRSPGSNPCFSAIKTRRYLSGFYYASKRDFARRGASCRLRREPRLAGVRHHNQVACAERNRHSGRAVAHYFLPAVGVDSGIKPLLIFRILYYNNVRSEYKRKVKSENKFNPLYNPRRVKSF